MRPRPTPARTHTDPKPDIIAVLEHYGTDVPGAVGWIAIRCPFHGDRSASASVNADYGKFRCHGCDIHGDAWDLICEFEGVELKEAIEIGRAYTATAARPTGRNPVSKYSTPAYTPPGRRGRK